MGDMEGLWRLQNHNNVLKEINNRLKEIANGTNIEKLKIKLMETENRLIKLETRIKDNENRLIKNNSILKNQDYQLKEIEKSLYEGNITDLKQLSFLDKERDVVRKAIEEKEMEILSQMDQMETLKKEFIKIEEDFIGLKKEYTSLIKDYKILIKDYKEKAIDEKKKIDEISSQIDKDLLKKYIHLTNSKGIAVVEVVEYRCSGCNMLLPTITIDRLKNNNVVVFCDNCDRMLYLRK